MSMVKRFTVLSALISLAMPAASIAAAKHPAGKAKSSPTITAWLKQCDVDELACENRLLKVNYDKVGCFASGDEADSYSLTPKVRAWFKDHPEHAKDKIDAGIIAAVKDLYPCKK